LNQNRLCSQRTRLAVAQGHLDEVSEFFELFGTLLTCGVLILQALKSLPARSTALEEFQVSLEG
jgi:hypothetical protein